MKIKTHWTNILDIVKSEKSYNKICLCFPVDKKGRLVKNNPSTLFNRQINHKGIFEKEGIELKMLGNKKGLTFDDEIVFI
jgi:hypothetical protein